MPRVAFMINDGHIQGVTTSERKGRMRGLVATHERRSAVVTLALVLSIAIQLMNLLDVFDGAPTWVWIVVIAVQVLLVAVAVLVSVVGMKERNARSRP